MNTLPYRAFLIAAQELNFTRAAERMYVSQQTLSHHIAKLEKNYDVQLFERTSPMKLTYAGKKMVILSKQIINFERSMRNEMGEISRNVTGELYVGVGRDRAYILTKTLPEFRKMFPNYTIHCIGGFNKQLSQMLAKEEIDMMISSTPQSMLELEAKKIMDDYLVLCIHEELLQKVTGKTYQELCKDEKSELDFKMFEQCPLAIGGENVKSRVLSDVFFRGRDLHPNITMTADHTEFMFQAAIMRTCAAVCFCAPLRFRLLQMCPEEQKDMHLIRIAGLSKTMPVEVSWLAEREHSNASIYLRNLLATQEEQ